MRVATMTRYDLIKTNLARISEDMIKASKVVSSGKRITDLSDDPVSLTQMLKIKSSLDNIDQLERNISVGNSWLSTAEGALRQTQNLLSDAKVLCIQMANGTIGAEQRQAAALTIQNILDEIISLGNTQIGGRYIFSGTKTDTAAFTYMEFKVDANNQCIDFKENGGVDLTATIPEGNYTASELEAEIESRLEDTSANNIDYTVSYDSSTKKFTIQADGLTQLDLLWANANSASSLLGFDAADDTGALTYTSDNVTVKYNGDNDPFAVKIGQAATIEVGSDGGSIFSGIFATLSNIAKDLQSNNTSGISSALDILETNSNEISNKISNIGSKMVRMEIKENILTDLTLANTKRLSLLEDADITEAIIELKSKELAYQAALASSARVMELSLVDYIR